MGYDFLPEETNHRDLNPLYGYGAKLANLTEPAKYSGGICGFPSDGCASFNDCVFAEPFSS